MNNEQLDQLFQRLGEKTAHKELHWDRLSPKSDSFVANNGQFTFFLLDEPDGLVFSIRDAWGSEILRIDASQSKSRFENQLIGLFALVQMHVETPKTDDLDRVMASLR